LILFKYSFKARKAHAEFQREALIESLYRKAQCFLFLDGLFPFLFFHSFNSSKNFPITPKKKKKMFKRKEMKNQKRKKDFISRKSKINKPAKLV